MWAICTASFWLGLLNSSYMKTLVTTGSPSEAVAAPFAELASASYPLSLLLLGWTGYCGILACPFPLVTRGADAPLLDLEDLEAIAFPTAASVAAMGVAFGGFGVIVAALMVVIAGLELAALTALFRLADGLIDRLQPDDDPP